MAGAAFEGHPLLSAEGKVVPIVSPSGRHAALWIRTLEVSVLPRLESAMAVRAWRREFGPILVSLVEAGHGDMVRSAEALIAARLDQLAMALPA